MTNVNSPRRSGRGIRRLVGALIAAGLLFGGVAAAGAPALAATAPATVEAAEVGPYVVPGPGPVERDAPGTGLTVFLISAVTLGAGGIATARVLGHRHHVAQERARA